MKQIGIILSLLLITTLAYAGPQVSKVTSAGGSISTGVLTITTPGTGVVLGSSTPAYKIIVTANLSNYNLIYLGDSSVSSSNGLEVATGVVTVIDTDNLANIYLDSVVGTDGVSFMVIQP